MKSTQHPESPPSNGLKSLRLLASSSLSLSPTTDTYIAIGVPKNDNFALTPQNPHNLFLFNELFDRLFSDLSQDWQIGFEKKTWYCKKTGQSAMIILEII